MLEPSIVTAFRKLQDLHDQWRETDPVANGIQGRRFGNVSRKRKHAYQQTAPGVFRKTQGGTATQPRTEDGTLRQGRGTLLGILTTRKWNKSVERLIEIQKVWKKRWASHRRRTTPASTNASATPATDSSARNEFYEQLKTEMDSAACSSRPEICEQAESLRESEQWKKTTDELLALRKDGKEIGPVPRRYSDAVWKRFRAATATVSSERKPAHFSGVDAQHERTCRRNWRC